jgi:hypothetical protein
MQKLMNIIVYWDVVRGFSRPPRASTTKGDTFVADLEFSRKQCICKQKNESSGSNANPLEDLCVLRLTMPFQWI